MNRCRVSPEMFRRVAFALGCKVETPTSEQPYYHVVIYGALGRILIAADEPTSTGEGHPREGAG